MHFDKDKYEEHLAVVREIRRTVEDALLPSGYDVIMTDSTGVVPSPSGANRGPEDRRPTVRVDLSQGLVTVVNKWALRREHAILESLGIAHEYEPASRTEADGECKWAVIRMGIDDAINHLSNIR